MSLFHPSIRLPLWAAFALPAAAYLYRSITRGFDFRLDLPLDVLVLAMFAFVLGLAMWSRRAAAIQRDDDAAKEQRAERDEP